MGMVLDSTPEMGEWSVEVRRESFYLRGPSEDDFIEPMLSDIPKIRASLDLIEQYLIEKKK